MYQEAKVYHDGSHYVAIPHTEGNHRKRPKFQEELVEVKEQEEVTKEVNEKVDKSTYSPTSDENSDKNDNFSDLPIVQAIKEAEKPPPKPKKKATRSQIFNALYDSTRDLSKTKRKSFIIKEMAQYFPNHTAVKLFVESKLQRKFLNYLNRRKRFIRKANMNNFNYFVTFTYNDELHTEESFRKKLSMCLANFQRRRQWRYMGVWERSPKGRLHFHGLLKVPDGTMPGKLFVKEDYNLNTKKMQKTTQNTFFNERFGRSDFDVLANNPRAKAEAYAYILKYIEKTGEKILYSRGLPLYVISDISDDDVLAEFDDDSGKLVLYDKFLCFDEGELIGEMSEDTKKRLRTANS